MFRVLKQIQTEEDEFLLQKQYTLLGLAFNTPNLQDPITDRIHNSLLGKVDDTTKFVQHWWTLCEILDGVVVSSAMISFRESINVTKESEGMTPFGTPHIYLHAIAVHPSHQKHGHGRALLQKVIKECSQLPYQGIWLWCKKPLRDFYGSVGFEAYSESKKKGEDWVIMSHALPWNI